MKLYKQIVLGKFDNNDIVAIGYAEWDLELFRVLRFKDLFDSRIFTIIYGFIGLFVLWICPFFIYNLISKPQSIFGEKIWQRVLYWTLIFVLFYIFLKTLALLRAVQVALKDLHNKPRVDILTESPIGKPFKILGIICIAFFVMLLLGFVISVVT